MYMMMMMMRMKRMIEMIRRKPHMFNTLNVRGQGLLTGQGDIPKKYNDAGWSW